MYKEGAHLNDVTGVLDLDFKAVGSNVPFIFKSMNEKNKFAIKAQNRYRKFVMEICYLQCAGTLRGLNEQGHKRA